MCWKCRIWSARSLTFRQRLLAARSLREDFLAFRDSLATETDTLLGVENGTFPNESLDSSGTAVDLVKGDLVDDLGSVLSVLTM